MDSRKGATDVRSHAETLWSYHQLGHALAPADLILVLCSHDTSVAGRYASSLNAGTMTVSVSGEVMTNSSLCIGSAEAINNRALRVSGVEAQ